eukprot:gene20633-26750_t
MKIDDVGQSIYVSYLFWNNSYDEWINNVDNNTAPLNTHTYYEGGPYKIGQRIEALDEKNMWLHAYIIDLNADKSRVRVHFHGYHSKFDLWLTSPSNQTRRFGKTSSSKKYSKAKLWRVPVSVPHEEHKDNNYSNNASSIENSSFNTIQSQRQRQIKGLSVIQIPGDGNCLFRSVAHQIYGDNELHWIVRQRCMDYMEAKRLNACWGDDPEIQAICELYDRPADIWAYDRENGARKLRTFHENSSRRSTRPPMRLSYYGGGHYDSIIDSNFSNNLVRQRPGEIEDSALNRLRQGQRLTVGSDNLETNADTLIRHNYNWTQQDLDSCLELSFHNDSLANSLAVIDSVEPTRADLPVPVRDVIATQTELLNQVRENSEREYLDKAILSSLEEDNETAIIDDVLLKEALEQSIITSDTNVSDTILGNDNLNKSAYKMVLDPTDNLSSLTEEEQLEIAIRQSMQQDLPINTNGTSKSESLPDFVSLGSQDTMLEAAIKASMNESYNNHMNISSAWESDAFDDDDEDINNAILESLRK